MRKPSPKLDPIDRVGKTTRETIAKLMDNSAFMDVVKHPEDYRAMAEEDVLRHEENTKARIAAHVDPDQDIMSDERRIGYRLTHISAFLRKLRDAGIKCWVVSSDKQEGLAGLYVLVPTMRGAHPEHISAVQYPYMSEWGCLRVGELGDVQGDRYIGWRQAVLQLIWKGLLTEAQALKIFGEPTPLFSERYCRTLWNLRRQGKVR